MKLIIAGGRDKNISALTIENKLKELNIYEKVTEIVSGGAKGIDSCGEKFALDQAFLSCRLFPADWEKNGRAAGPIRNKQMANYADALLLVWDGKSKGSANMKKEMEKLNKPVYEMILGETNGY